MTAPDFEKRMSDFIILTLYQEVDYNDIPKRPTPLPSDEYKVESIDFF